MEDHLIRLRAGWECVDPDSLDSRGRLTLPVFWPAGQGRIRLIRKFGCPPLDARSEEVFLSLSRVSGLLVLSLNGRQLPLEDAFGGMMEIPLGTLEKRNELVVEAKPVAINPSDEPATWGEIALLIRRRAAESSTPNQTGV